MITDFYIISGTTVPSNYTWDSGVPFSIGVEESQAYSTANYISGYAPGLKVLFDNTSITDQSSEFTLDYLDYVWNFGDYYNDGGNVIALSCIIPVEHIFIMPGRYTVSLTQVQTTTQTIVDAGPDLCFDLYNLNWYWSNMECSQFDAKTWDDTICSGPFKKWWDNELVCFQKYCKFWTWEQLKSTNVINKVKWEETTLGAPLEKRWFFESNDTICSVPNFLDFTATERQTTTKEYIVEVKEIMPVARLHSETQPITGVSNITIQLSPRVTKAGSFPIDRIDWDFGDGTPIKIVTRQGDNLNDRELINTQIFSNDPLDPRNFDTIHTYHRSADIYSVFYPSITAYSANTGSYDSCSTTIGPIYLPDPGPNIKLIKSKNTVNGVMYSIEHNDSCSFVTNASILQNTSINPLSTIPINTIQNSYGLPIIYLGNNGNNYQLFIDPNCQSMAFPRPDFFALLTEENPTTTSDLSALSAIVQQNESYILIS